MPAVSQKKTLANAAPVYNALFYEEVLVCYALYAVPQIRKPQQMPRLYTIHKKITHRNTYSSSNIMWS